MKVFAMKALMGSLGIVMLFAVVGNGAVIPVAQAAGTDYEFLPLALDPASGEFPEGITVDASGNIYYSLAPRGEVWRATPDGDLALWAALDPNLPQGAQGALGLAIDSDGEVYAALMACNADGCNGTHGVWQIQSQGNMVKLPGTVNIAWPNALAMGPDGELYVSDSLGGAIWVVRRQAGGGFAPAEIWIQDAALQGNGALGLGAPIGANGVAYAPGRNEVLVANTEKGLILAIPIQPDGTAGAIETVAQGAALISVDGIAVDRYGDVLALTVARVGAGGPEPVSQLLRVDRDSGEVEVLVAGGPLFFSTSLAFGRLSGSTETIFVANWAVLAPMFGLTPAPSITGIDLRHVWDESEATPANYAFLPLALDPASGQFPEGITVDASGNLYYSLVFTGEVWQATPDGDLTLWASLDPHLPPGAGGTAGLAIDQDGDIYAALMACNADGCNATHGVWQISGPGAKEKLPGTAQILFPNALAFGPDGELYVSDSLGGAIWIVRRSDDGTTWLPAEVWIQDEALLGNGSLGLGAPVGANGVAYSPGRNEVLVANTEKGLILAIPIKADGTAGAIETVAQGTTLIPVDGIAVDRYGDVLALTVARIGEGGLELVSQLLHVDRDSGEVKVVLDGEPLFLSTSLAFGRLSATTEDVFVANWALLAAAYGLVPEPAIVRAHLQQGWQVDNEPPVAEDGSLTTGEDTPASGTLVASDPDGDALTFSIVDEPAHGGVTLDDPGTGAYTYTPDAGFSGSDSFTFTANDGFVDSNVATISITVNAAPPPPPPPPPSDDGGGGAFGVFGLLALLVMARGGLGAARLRRRHPRV
ncbi:MAG: Ig-like domain-containing protein [Gammaproteobacteria bacterium]|nr:Ig-like domain-containing protein [Gammaproteobacteria bacterium]